MRKTSLLILTGSLFSVFGAGCLGQGAELDESLAVDPSPYWQATVGSGGAHVHELVDGCLQPVQREGGWLLADTQVGVYAFDPVSGWATTSAHGQFVRLDNLRGLPADPGDPPAPYQAVTVGTAQVYTLEAGGAGDCLTATTRDGGSGQVPANTPIGVYSRRAGWAQNSARLQFMRETDLRFPSTSTPVAGRWLSDFWVTHYTYALEQNFATFADFVCARSGVTMQGSGIARNGTFVQYQGGLNISRDASGYVNECDYAVQNTVNLGSTAPAGRSGRAVVPHFSIAVDPGVIPLGSCVYVERAGQWFRADDTGGGVHGSHIDIFIGTGHPTGAEGYGNRVFVSRSADPSACDPSAPAP